MNFNNSKIDVNLGNGTTPWLSWFVIASQISLILAKN